MLVIPEKYSENSSVRGIPLIVDEASYQWAISRIDELIELDDELDKRERRALVLLVEDYELRDAPKFPNDPVDAIEFYMAQNGLSQVDFAKKAKLPPSRVSEVISGTRGISLTMIRSLYGLGFPSSVLITKPSRLSNTRPHARHG